MADLRVASIAILIILLVIPLCVICVSMATSCWAFSYQKVSMDLKKEEDWVLFLTLWPPHLEQSPPRHQTLCYSLFLEKQTQDISLLTIFQLSNFVLHPYQSVQCVYVCVCVCVCVHVYVHECVRTHLLHSYA